MPSLDPASDVAAHTQPAVRSSLSPFQIFGQYLASALMASLGIGIGARGLSVDIPLGTHRLGRGIGRCRSPLLCGCSWLLCLGGDR
jgi:hypothetical protein